ncbi:MAG: tRNA pseudouridine(55) synthase TruB [Rhodospirillaceae bacterium]|jgi:tRNA pseudouridine55 synthase|nr:tRNA pseudouridine(55) synthase TruB [Rhodospirillaceae bacterium]MBT4219228.1 tRNA pseudouridine(55) synthase TruB [Rhodospirillaceae bacterium]MBT5012937.1 tRNA pseudouridine(55) synthase TruB [Rhodospirillaceae bacterium]MBT5307981.1 tRNA pseudouridine(55) synthase TruB [Rhodospirillaceae bacterium]MBT6406548.1 tRNA pseudouridine(55) synthase TruB [Rhodospirillaceae bacterium]
MARKRKGDPIHGWLIVDKPGGLTSSAVVGKVKRALNAAKAGHGGTLDPMATGILPIALGEATKTMSYVMDGAKKYRFTVRWGEARTTDDAEGEITNTSDVRPARQDIVAILDEFVGDIEQVPPDYSAIKQGGKRAYDMARENTPLVLDARTIHIDSFDLVDIADADHATFDVACGKGSYMRGLARDLGLKLGTFGHISALRRLVCGPFDESHAISLDSIISLGHSAPLLAVETALDDIPALALTAEEARSLQHGQAVSVLPVASRSSLEKVDPGAVYCAMAEGKMVALTKIVGGEIRPFKVLNQ